MADQQRFFFLDLRAANVKGGSAKKGHEDWIEPDSWDFKMNQVADVNVKGGRPSKTAATGTFSFSVKHNGPAIFMACAKGQAIPDKITFEAERGGLQVVAGAGQKTTNCYFQLIFENSVISSRNLSGDEGQKTEEVTLTFQKVTMSYRQVVNGVLQGPLQKSYDAKANQAA